MTARQRKLRFDYFFFENKTRKQGKKIAILKKNSKVFFKMQIECTCKLYLYEKQTASL